MPIKILMPALSPTMTEGKLAKWHVTEGKTVSAGDVIAEIETDKATMEVEAVDEGTIGKILIQEGTESVAVNDIIAVLLEDGEKPSDIDGFLNDNKAPSAPEKKSEKTEEIKKEDVKKAEPVKEKSNRVFASPLAKRIAANKNIDLSTIKGSGPHGRIVKADLDNAKSAATVTQAQTSKSVSPSGPDAKSLADALGLSYQEIANSGMRKTIAARLTESKQTVPHFYLTVDCEIDALLALRKDMNEDATDYKLSVNDFVIRAVARALHMVPAANASWTDNAIIQYDNIDVSVAVATDNGLITPIVKEADKKSISAISNEMKDLAARAREGKLKPSEYQGGGFTISNLGMFGIKQFSAIINPPQSCILAVGAGEQRPVVKNGQLAIANVMTCTLSVDHRSVDGAVGAEFLSVFKKLIENPGKILA